MPSHPATPSAPEQPSRARPGGWLGILILLIAIVTPLWHLHIINRNMPPNKADMIAIWKGAQAAFKGQNPYLEATTLDIQRFYYGHPLTSADDANPMGYAYPIHAIVLFAPIARLSWPATRLVFLVLLPLLTAASISLWLQVIKMQLRPRTYAFTLILSLCSWPVMWGVHQVQPSLIVAALVAAGCFLITRENYTAAGILVAMATIKPQLIGILLAWLLLWTILRGVWRFLVSFAVTTSALLACGTWLLPNWLPAWRTASEEYSRYRHLRLDLQAVIGNRAGLALAFLLVISTVRILWHYRRCLPASREFGAICALCLALTVCVLPTEAAMIYNHVFLFPACYLIIRAAPGTPFPALVRFLTLALLVWMYVAVAIAATAETLVHPIAFLDALPFLTYPLSTLVLVALILPLLKQISEARTIQTQPA